MNRVAQRSVFRLFLIAALALGVSSCGESEGFSSIDCTFSVAWDGEPQSASMPKETGDMSLVAGQLEATVSVTVGDHRGTIDVTVQGPITADDPTLVDIALAGSRFERRQPPGSLLLATGGGSASNGPFSFECSSS